MLFRNIHFHMACSKHLSHAQMQASSDLQLYANPRLRARRAVAEIPVPGKNTPLLSCRISRVLHLLAMRSLVVLHKGNQLWTTDKDFSSSTQNFWTQNVKAQGFVSCDTYGVVTQILNSVFYNTPLLCFRSEVPSELHRRPLLGCWWAELPDL